MPTYIISGKAGDEYEIDVPDGVSEEDALISFQKHMATQNVPAIPGTGMKGMGAPPGFPEPPTPAELDALKAAGKPWPKPEDILAQMERPPKNDKSPSIARTIFDQSMQGATFGFADEAQDRIGAFIASQVTGENYDDLLRIARENSKVRMQAQMDQNPGTSLAANLAGGLLTGVAGAGTKAGTAVANSLRTGNLASRAGKAGLAGLASGGLFGAGSADEGGRLAGAGEGAALGFGVGAALPVAGAAIKKGATTAIDKFADAATKTLATRSGEISRDGLSKEMKKVYDRLRADFPDDAEFTRQLNSYASKKGKTLLEIGGSRTENLAEGSGLFPSGEARAKAFFDEAIGSSPERIKGILSKTVSPNVNYYDTLDDVVGAGRKKASPIYQEAFKKNQSVQSDVIDKILRTPEGKSSLNEAVKNMQNEMTLAAKPDKELTAAIRELSDDGENITGVGWASGLKLRTLDYVKKAMDSNINKAYRAGDEGEARRLVSLKNGLVFEIDRLDRTGLYAKARKTSGDYLSNKDAMDMGLNFLREDPEIVKRAFKDFGRAEKESYKVGVLKAMRTNIENKTDGRNVTELFQSPATREKLQSILRPAEYQKLVEEARAVDNIYKLRNKITGNSRTALRQIAAEEFDDQAQQVLTDLIQKGFTRTTLETGVKLIKRQFGGLNDKLAGDVANILYETDPKKKFRIVKGLVNQANSEGAGLRKTEAAKKLAVFYNLSDRINKARAPVSPVISGQVGKQP